SRRNLNWSSTARPPARSGWTSRRACSPSSMKSSSDRLGGRLRLRLEFGAKTSLLVAHKLLEVGLLTFGLAPTPVSEPFLGGRKAVPSWNVCSQVYRLPKRVTRRFVELAELREECIDEFCSPLISHRAFLPVECNQDGDCGNCINHPLLLDQSRIIFV